MQCGRGVAPAPAEAAARAPAAAPAAPRATAAVVTVDAAAAVAATASSCATGKNLRNSELQNLEKEEVGSAAQPGGERVSEREHEREGREKEGGYSETARRAPKRGREEQQRNEFQVVHIAPAKRRLMERLEGMPRGDG